MVDGSKIGPQKLPGQIDSWLFSAYNVTSGAYRSGIYSRNSSTYQDILNFSGEIFVYMYGVCRATVVRYRNRQHDLGINCAYITFSTLYDFG